MVAADAWRTLGTAFYLDAARRSAAALDVAALLGLGAAVGHRAPPASLARAVQVEPAARVAAVEAARDPRSVSSRGRRVGEAVDGRERVGVVPGPRVAGRQPRASCAARTAASKARAARGDVGLAHGGRDAARAAGGSPARCARRSGSSASRAGRAPRASAPPARWRATSPAAPTRRAKVTRSRASPARRARPGRRPGA